MNPPVFLVGFMGSGKTRTGKELAERLAWEWIDLDDQIVETAGKSIPQIFSGEGEEHFRQLERRCLQKVLSRENLVVSCGGGIVTQPESLNLLLEQPRVICLRISPETVFRRVGNDPRRPLLQGADSMGIIRSLMREREPCYSRFPHQIDVDKRNASEVVDEIVGLLELEG